MDDSGAILCQLSALKDMIDQVNEEIEASFQVTREIEAGIVKCMETEATLACRESELTKSLRFSQFDLIGLLSVASESMKSVRALEEELSCLRKKREEMSVVTDIKREQFINLCVEYQREICKDEASETLNLLAEKESLENEIHQLNEKNNALKTSMSAFVEEVLEDLHQSNTALQAEIQNKNLENTKLVKQIDDLKSLLLSQFNYDI